MAHRADPPLTALEALEAVRRLIGDDRAPRAEKRLTIHLEGSTADVSRALAAACRPGVLMVVQAAGVDVPPGRG